jgi:hypothetical protein
MASEKEVAAIDAAVFQRLHSTTAMLETTVCCSAVLTIQDLPAER